MRTFYIIGIPKRSIEGLPDISLLSPIITFNCNIAQDHRIGQMPYLEVTPLPPYLFGETIRSAALDVLITESQEKNEDQLKQLQTTHGWTKQNGQWRKEGRLVVNDELTKRHILKEHHDHPTSGHPGAATTYFSIRTRYW